jgi:hypothetical protein
MGDLFPSDMGVKQGDPLSPLLFGLFIDMIEGFLAEKFPQIGVKLRDIILQVLLYADDLVILAESPQELQSLLNGLSEFCDVYSLTVNVKKSEMVVFNSRSCRPSVIKELNIQYKGAPLVAQPHFNYLGIVFSDGESVPSTAVPKNLMKAKQTAQMMLRKCYAMNVHNIHLQLTLFDALVKPVMNYGCEIWGPYLMAKKGVATGVEGPVEVWHLVLELQ